MRAAKTGREGMKSAREKGKINPGDARGINTWAAAARPGAARWLLWIAPLAFLGFFFFHPLARILLVSLDFETITSDNIRHALYVLRFTLYQAALSTLFTLLLGLPAAYLFARFEFPGRSLLRALTLVPFMLPTVVVAAGFNALLGPRGWLNLGAMDLFGLESPPFRFMGTLGAILTAHVFYNTAIVIRVVGGALAGLDPRLGQAARTLGADPARAWRHVILPLLRPSLLSAALLVFLFDFTSFGVILLLGDARFPTLEYEIYTQTVKFLNLPLAAFLTLIQLTCTLLLSIGYSRLAARAAVQSSPRVHDQTTRARSAPERAYVGVMLVVLLAFYVLPLLALPLRSVSRLEAARGERGQVQFGLTGEYYAELFVNRRGSVFYVPPVQAALNSLGYAAATVLLSLLLGLPAASALARPGRLEKILDPLLILPLGASAVTLGLGYILAFNRPPALLPDLGPLIASPLLIPLAHTILALPFVIRILQPALASIPYRLRHAAASLGAPPLRAWLAVDWPILRRAALAAGTFAFTLSLGDFGAAILLTRPQYPTIPVAIYRFLSQPWGLNYGQAMAMATILMVLTAASILVIEKTRLPGAREF